MERARCGVIPSVVVIAKNLNVSRLEADRAQRLFVMGVAAPCVAHGRTCEGCTTSYREANGE